MPRVRTYLCLAALLSLACPKPGPDPTEPNNDFDHAHRVTLASTVSAAFDSLNDEDWFVARTRAGGGILQWSIEPSDSTGPFVCALYNLAEKELWVDTVLSPLPVSFWLDAGTNKDYYLRLELIEGVPATYAITARLDTILDPNEPDDDFAHATPLRLDSTCVAWFFAGEPFDEHSYDDFYVIDARGAAGDTLSFELTLVPADVKPRLSVYDSYYQRVAEDSAGLGGNVTVGVVALDSHYYLVASVVEVPSWVGTDSIPAHDRHPYALRVKRR